MEDFENFISICAYKPEARLDSDERHAWEIERSRCRISFVHFLKYVKVVIPPTPGVTGGITSLEMWPHLKEVIGAYLTKRLITILKARQIGLSTITAAYVLWHVLTKVGSRVLLFSEGEKASAELLSKARRIYDNLPGFLTVPRLDPESTEQLGFPPMKSILKAFPSTPMASIGETGSIIVWDEHAAHPYAEENYSASKPTIDSSGGQAISIFTAPPFDIDNLATSIFNDAVEGKNDFTPLFFPWTVVPGRDSEWYDYTKRNIPKTILGRMTPELYMQRNYPLTIKEALKPSERQAAFDHKVLDQMMGDVKEPVKETYPGVDPTKVKIYQPFYAGVPYIASTDTSHGVGLDYSVTVIMNCRTGAVVADIMGNDIQAEELAFLSVRLLGLYQNPLWFIENNDWGGVTISKAQALGYKNFGYDDEKKTKVGFNTNAHRTTAGMKGSRVDLYGELISGVNTHQITIYNAKGLGQFYDLIRNTSKGGRIEAIKGKHDDYPIAVGICWYKRGEVRSNQGVRKPIQTLDFSRSY